MSILLDFTDAKFDALTGRLSIKPVNVPYLRQWLVREYKDGVTYTAEIKRFRKRRSKNANDLCWAMCEQLADAIRSTKEEVYRDQIRKVGVYKDFHLPPKEAKTFRAAWAQLGTGWLTEQVDDDGPLLVIRAYYGSSRYNTKQMSRLIDSLMEDCEAVGVVTISEKDKALLLDDWEKRQFTPRSEAHR